VKSLFAKFFSELRNGKKFCTQFAAKRLKIPTTWMKIDWRGKIRYEVRIFPFGIGFLKEIRI